MEMKLIFAMTVTEACPREENSVFTHQRPNTKENPKLKLERAAVQPVPTIGGGTISPPISHSFSLCVFNSPPNSKNEYDMYSENS